MRECFFCKGQVVEQRIQHIHQWGEQIIIFENVPAEVCQECGEVFFAPEVLEAMDRIVLEEQNPRTRISVPVFFLAESATV